MLSPRWAQFLLEELCVDLGFCLPPEARRRLVAHAPAEPEAFAAAVFRAEGMERGPSTRGLYRQVLAAAERAYGRDRPAAI